MQLPAADQPQSSMTQHSNFYHIMVEMCILALKSVTSNSLLEIFAASLFLVD